MYRRSRKTDGLRSFDLLEAKSHTIYSAGASSRIVRDGNILLDPTEQPHYLSVAPQRRLQQRLVPLPYVGTEKHRREGEVSESECVSV